ncbi:unnamed protein product, partial [Prorocentrum cordatum]
IGQHRKKSPPEPHGPHLPAALLGRRRSAERPWGPQPRGSARRAEVAARRQLGDAARGSGGLGQAMPGARPSSGPMDSAPARRARAAAAGRRPRALPAAAAGALALLCGRSLAACFAAPRPLGEPARVPAVARGAGFGDVEAPEAKPKKEVRRSSAVKQEDLERDHGDMWQAVDSIFSGQKAESPEVIMRARFTALKFKDPNFLAATELDEDKRELKERADQWAVTLGLKDKSPFDFIVRLGDEGSPNRHSQPAQ